MDSKKDVQATGAKEQNQRGLLTRRDLEGHDNGQRDEQDENVNDGVCGAEGHHGDHAAQTRAVERLVPELGHGDALEDHEELVDDGVHGHDANQNVHGPAEVALHRQAQVEGQHGQLGEGHGARVEDGDAQLVLFPSV